MAEYIEREAVIDEIESTTWYHINCQKIQLKELRVKRTHFIKPQTFTML